MSEAARDLLRFLDYSIPADVDLLYRGESVVPLEPKPVQVLRYLAENRGRVVSKQELLDAIWPGVFTTEGVLKRAVSHCRHALGDDADAPAFVETCHGRGYRFMPEVVRASTAPAPTLAPAAGLPAEPASFVGRAAELAELERVLAEARLVTITGPGGIGKTRLALRLAHRTAARFDGGARFVALEAVADPALVGATVCDAFGVRDAARRAPAEALAEALGDRDVLLVLDTCEHLVDACADFVDRLLRAAPRARVLATSREPLRVPGEVVRAVGVLEAPARVGVAPERLAEFDAVRLFVERASAADAAFRLDAGNAAAVASICRRLEGIPLAIELAAARARAMSAEELAVRLDDRFRLLTLGDRTAPERRRTLRAAIDWSYDLLTDDERALFRALSVFAGGFGLDGARAVGATAATADVEDALSRLVDKSLVVATTSGATARYRMLDTVREYAAGRLADEGEAGPAARAHAEWVLAIAEAAERAARGPRERACLARLGVEHDNVREALRWWRDGGEDAGYGAAGHGAAGHGAAGHGAAGHGAAGYGARLAYALRRFWDVQGHWDEGLEWLYEVLAREDELDPPARADALFAAGLLGRHQADFRSARAQLAECVDLRRAAGDARGVAYALNALGNLLEYTGETEAALAMHEESRDLFERTGDEIGRAMALSALGMCALNDAEYARAEALYVESLRLAREAGDAASAGIMLHNLGDIAYRLGDAERAKALFGESLEIATEFDYKILAANSLALLGDIAAEEGDARRAGELYREVLDVSRDLGDRVRIAYVLEAFARGAGARGDASLALRLAGAAARVREETGAPAPDDEAAVLRRALDAARAALGDEAADEAVAGGRALGLDRALALALDA